MKCKTRVRFTDLKADKIREIGEEFEVTKERFEVLEEKGLVEVVVEKDVEKPKKEQVKETKK